MLRCRFAGRLPSQLVAPRQTRRLGWAHTQTRGSTGQERHRDRPRRPKPIATPWRSCPSDRPRPPPNAMTNGTISARGRGRLQRRRTTSRPRPASTATRHTGRAGRSGPSTTSPGCGRTCSTNCLCWQQQCRHERPLSLGVDAVRGAVRLPTWARRSSPPPWRRVADHQSQRRADDGTGQAVDALECPRLGWAPAKEPAERVPELVVGHEPVGFVL